MEEEEGGGSPAGALVSCACSNACIKTVHHVLAWFWKPEERRALAPVGTETAQAGAALRPERRHAASGGRRGRPGMCRCLVWACRATPWCREFLDLSSAVFDPGTLPTLLRVRRPPCRRRASQPPPCCRHRWSDGWRKKLRHCRRKCSGCACSRSCSTPRVRACGCGRLLGPGGGTAHEHGGLRRGREGCCGPKRHVMHRTLMPLTGLIGAGSRGAAVQGPLVNPGILVEPRAKAGKGGTGAGDRAPSARGVPSTDPPDEAPDGAPGLGLQQLAAAARQRLWDNLRSWLPGSGKPAA